MHVLKNVLLLAPFMISIITYLIIYRQDFIDDVATIKALFKEDKQ